MVPLTLQPAYLLCFMLCLCMRYFYRYLYYIAYGSFFTD